MPAKRRHLGFTLIEMVVGMVVFSVVMVMVINLVMSQSRRSIDPVIQVKAAELAQSLLTEIMSKSFDENASRDGSDERCNETTACTQTGSLGPDSGETRATFNDVDDYHGIDQSGAAIENSLGQAMTANGRYLYQGYRVQIEVFYDDNQDGINDADTDNDGNVDDNTVVGDVKLIKLYITTPQDDVMPFAVYRWNF